MGGAPVGGPAEGPVEGALVGAGADGWEVDLSFAAEAGPEAAAAFIHAYFPPSPAA